MALILTRPQGSSSGGVPGTIIENITIPGTGDAPNNVVPVDLVTPSGTKLSVKWIYTLCDPTNNKVMTGEIMAAYADDGGTNVPKYNRYGIVGDIIPHLSTVKVQGSDVILEISNLQTDDIVVTVVRIQSIV